MAGARMQRVLQGMMFISPTEAFDAAYARGRAGSA
jgi:hypothetical protein